MAESMTGPIKVVIELGEPIEVSTERDRSARVDPLMAKLQDELQGDAEPFGPRIAPLQIENVFAPRAVMDQGSLISFSR